MAATAKLNREYALRLCGVGLVMLALSAWSVYDGAVAWPRENRALESVRDKFAAVSDMGATPEAWLASPPDRPGEYPLKALFAEIGRKPPRRLVEELASIKSPAGDDDGAKLARIAQAKELFSKPLYPPGKLKGQFVQALVTLVLAALAFWSVASKRGVEYSAGDEGLSGSGFGGAAIPWDEVASVDWTRWDEKGIFTVTLADGRKFKLDGWHFAPMRPIAQIVMEHKPRG